MLVCSVSQGPQGRVIPVALAEAAAALDALTSGFAAFSMLVDEPVSASDAVDGYIGEIMLEPANANDTVDAGLGTYVASVIEAASATDTVDVAATFATFDGTPTNVTLSLGNLKATHSNTITNSGARSNSLKISGQWYFEITVNQTNGTQDCSGMLTSSGTYTDLVTNGTNCLVAYASGTIVSNNTGTGKSLGTIAAGNVIGIAVDLTARKGWMRKNGGNWNGDATANPATGTNGVTLAATVSFAPAVGFGGSFSAVNDAMTMNAGQSAFANAAPSGFNGWA
jgi:hypothetical protein